jgi:hypothetical protein
MKAKILISLIAISVFSFTCSKDNPTKPEEDNTGNLVASETIGPAGGDLSTDDFSLSVPRGAFVSEVDVKLYTSIEEGPFGENGVTPQYKIEGLPVNYTQPLLIKIKYQGNLSGEKQIAIGENVFVPSLGDTTTVYNIFPATDSSGFLVTSLPVPQSRAHYQITLYKNTRTDLRLFAKGIISHPRYLTTDGHFSITYYEESVSSYLEGLGTFFEESFKYFQKLGYKHEQKRNWPAQVIVRKISGTNPPLGLYHNSFFGDNYGSITINSELVVAQSNFNSIYATVGHEVFHLVQYLYDSRYGPTKW